MEDKIQKYIILVNWCLMKQTGSAHIIVMGVSGCGKSTLGRAIATQLGIEFLEGDEYHPKENLDKMKGGIPLNDLDRQPWLAHLNKRLREAKLPLVLACSALKQQYRDRLSKGLTEPPIWVYLEGQQALLEKRMAQRNHFMPISLLESQFADLEKPSAALVLSCALTTKEQLDKVIPQIG